MYGGSMPIAKYLADALTRLGHHSLLIENATGLGLFQHIWLSMNGSPSQPRLINMHASLLEEWTYARMAELKPEICIVLAQAPVSPAFPERLRKLGIVSAYWFVENWRHMTYWRDIAPAYDGFFHVQPGEFERELDLAGCKLHAYVQTGCDPSVHRPVDLSDDERATFACDLSFAGAGYRNRAQLFQGLADYEFKIWGVGWDERVLARHVVSGDQFFSTETYMKIVSGSKINLNLHSSANHEGVDPTCDAVNPRVFEIAAAGGFQLCDPCGNLASLFDLENELPGYRDLGELRVKIDHYLAHPEERNLIARRARKRALAEHTYEHRAAQMLSFISSLKRPPGAST